MTQFTKNKIHYILNELENQTDTSNGKVHTNKNATPKNARICSDKYLNENTHKTETKQTENKVATNLGDDELFNLSDIDYNICDSEYDEDDKDYYSDDNCAIPGDHSGHKERLRRKAIEDITSLSEHEMLELLLNFSIVRKNTNNLAHELITRYGTLANVCNTSVENLMQVRGLGKVSASMLNLLPKIIEVYKNSLLNVQGAIITRSDLKLYFKKLLEIYKKETAFALCLDKNNQILDCITLGKGTVDQIKLPIVDAVPLMLESHPYRVVLAHNHLTKNAQPSYNDITYTNQLKNMLEKAGVILYDHIIISKDEIYSFAENKLL